MNAQDEIVKRQLSAFQRAFLASIESIKNIRPDSVLQSVMTQLDILIERGDVDGIMSLLGIDRSAFSDVAEEIRASMRAGGAFTAAAASPVPTAIGPVILRYDMASVTAAKWIGEQSSRLITEIIDDQRTLIREHLAAGTEAGINPRAQAQGLIGQIDRASGGRKGGIIGLTSQQSGWMRKASAEIDSLSTNYLARNLRDPRFDAAFKKARETGEAIPAKTKAAMLRALEDNTLTYRAETIARTESINALRAGQNESLRQAMAKGSLKSKDVIKIWDSTGRDGRTRDSHLALDGKRTQFDGLFKAKGGLLAYPGDASHGASASETVQCRCKVKYRVDYLKKEIQGFS